MAPRNHPARSTSAGATGELCRLRAGMADILIVPSGWAMAQLLLRLGVAVCGGIGLARPIKVKIKRAVGAGDLPLPVRMTQHAAGFDLHAAMERTMRLKPGEIRMIPCGFSMALPAGYEAQIRPRSGLASRHGITLVNSPGTIDADYRGEVQAPVINLGRRTFAIERGMRIAQMVIKPVPRVKLIEVKRLDATGRGKGGFGHTGN